jgi:hypothetical protein
MKCQTSVTCIFEPSSKQMNLETAIQTSSTPGNRSGGKMFSQNQIINTQLRRARTRCQPAESQEKKWELARDFFAIAAEMGIWGDYREGYCGNGFPSSFDVEVMDVGLQVGLTRRLHRRYVGHRYVCQRGKTPVETTIIQSSVGRPINLVIYPSSRASRISKRLPSDSLSPRVPPPCPIFSRGSLKRPQRVIAQTEPTQLPTPWMSFEMTSENHSDWIYFLIATVYFLWPQRTFQSTGGDLFDSRAQCL